MIGDPAPFPLYNVHDPVSSFTHLAGAAAFACLTPRLMRGTSGWARVSLGVFAASAVVLLLSSGLFHWWPAGGARQLLQRLDHAAIFVLIAGTFTPIHTILFRGAGRWGVLWLIWTLAAAGVTMKMIYFTEVPEWLSVGAYVAMGWLGIFGMITLARERGIGFVLPLVFGGIIYSIGACLELAKWPMVWPGILRPHELFHLAVLGGLTCHWWFVERAAAIGARGAAKPLWIPGQVRPSTPTRNLGQGA